MHFEKIHVQCREEYQSQQEPRSFQWRGKHYAIRSIVDRWYEGFLASQRVPLRYFRVETESSERFIIRYNELFGAWSLLVSQEMEEWANE